MVGTCFNTTSTMFTQLDYELFPNTPEVYKLPSGELVAKILKNASSSLDKQGYKLANKDEIRTAEVITVYWRDPIERFKSGVSTFVQQTGMEVEHVVKYLFLNRHYAPQFYTLINLQRFMRQGAMFRIKRIDEVSKITEYNEQPYPNKLDVAITDKVNFYLTPDKLVWERYVGSLVLVAGILNVLRVDYEDYYAEVFEHSKNILQI